MHVGVIRAIIEVSKFICSCYYIFDNFSFFFLIFMGVWERNVNLLKKFNSNFISYDRGQVRIGFNSNKLIKENPYNLLPVVNQMALKTLKC